MRRVLYPALAIACANGMIASASAQSLLETLAGIKFCRTLKDDAQRLKCFDELFAEKPAEQSSAAPDVELTWNIREDKSPIDDSPQVTGLLALGDKSGGLILRCKERKTEAYFTRQFTYLGHDSVKVLVRINDGKPIETMWSASTDGQAAFAPSAVQFIRALPDKGKLFIRVFAYGGKTADGEFNLGAVSEVREKIAQACNWSAARPAPPAQSQKK